MHPDLWEKRHGILNELQSWVSQPVDQHYFAVSAFDQLDKILKQIVANACPHS